MLGFAVLLIATIVVVCALPPPPQPLPTGPLQRDGYVQPCGQHLCLDGKLFTVKGVNYFPAYFKPYTVHWLDPRYYKRETVETDVAFLASINVNTLVIQAIVYWVPLSPGYISNILDFLDISKKYNMRVVLFSDGCNPFSPVPSMCEELIQKYNISMRPEVLGYDIQWEAHLGTASIRDPLLASHYQAWLLDRFNGKLAVTECYDIFPTPSNDTELCSSSYDPQVATFRRFVDDYSGYLYMLQVQKMRLADPCHLIGFRNGYGGNGFEGVCTQFPLDLRTAARVVDYIAPEAYAFQVTGSDIPAMLSRGGFTAAYADVGKPIILMEFGYTALCVSCSPEQQDALLADQAEYYTNLSYVVQAKGFSGLNNWWPVGQRPKNKLDTEVSDYGLLYDYSLYPTAVDVLGNPSRESWQQLCMVDANTVLAVTYDDTTGQSYACPSNTSPLGTFKPAVGANTSVTGTGFNGVTIYSGWMALCGNSDDPSGLYIASDGDTQYACPTNTTNAGSFMPEISPTNQTTAIGRDGKSISNGWMMLCLSTTFARSSGLYTAINMLSPSLQYSCNELSPNSVYAGAFVPNPAPLFKPATSVYSTFLASYAAIERDYNEYIQIDRDAIAADYMMYTNGATAYAEKGSYNLIGVSTQCSNTSSISPLLCVGNTKCGQCPPKCLNAEFDAIWIWNTQLSEWIIIASVPGETTFNITLPASTPLIVTAQVGNTGESTWLESSQSSGTVYFGCNENRGDIACRQSILSNVSWLQTTTVGPFVALESLPNSPVSIVFQMVAENIAWYGPTVSVTITPS